MIYSDYMIKISNPLCDYYTPSIIKSYTDNVNYTTMISLLSTQEFYLET